jgi:hypothetical protein
VCVAFFVLVAGPFLAFFFSLVFFEWLTIGKFDCAFVAGELAFSFHIVSACDVCCDLRRRRKK